MIRGATRPLSTCHLSILPDTGLQGKYYRKAAEKKLVERESSRKMAAS